MTISAERLKEIEALDARGVELCDAHTLREYIDAVRDLLIDRPTILARLEALEGAEVALATTQASELAHSNCEECNGEGEAERCGKCFPAADDARVKRITALTTLRAAMEGTR